MQEVCDMYYCTVTVIPDILGTVLSVLIKGGILILVVVLYTSLCRWGHA